MREHLKSFFDEFEFDSRERVALAIAYERIAESAKARERFMHLIDGYERDTRFLKSEHLSELEAIGTAAGVHPYTVILLTVICMFRTLRERLTKIGLSKRIVANTLNDVKWKMKEGEKLHGVVGTEHFNWYLRFLELKLFGIGRLQFELKVYNDDDFVCKEGRKLKSGEGVVGIHIPRNGEPLEDRAVSTSLRDAKKVFTALLGTSNIPFICSSWMLYPYHRDFLDQRSNIVKFMNRFELIKTVNYRKDRNDAIPFVFEVKSNTPVDLLPVNTTLQRAYKTHLSNDGRMGVGLGVLFVEDTKPKA